MNNTIHPGDEVLWDRAYNLNLYLEYVREKYPSVYNELVEKFSGLPGFERVVE